MSSQVFRCSLTRRSFCTIRCLSCRTRTYYSQSTFSLVGRTRVFASGRTRTIASTRQNFYHTLADPKDPLSPTRFDRYLASIKVADLHPTLDDVERHKPESFSRPDSPRYAIEYTNLLETLCRSFSKDQLRRFTELYKLDAIWTRSSRRKAEYAESIIEKAWCWPSLKEIERKQRDTSEVLVKSFAVTPSQLFLIMGKDGADLLQLSIQHNVHISLTSSPLALRVEGLRGSLKGLTEHISAFKKEIINEIFELPSGRPVQPNLLQRISRLSGAYIENHGNKGKVRICARDLSDIATAKGLALRASLEVRAQERTVCYDPPNRIMDSPIDVRQIQRCGMYPFVTPYSSPWTMHSGNSFRLRRIADWLGVDSCEDIVSTGGLADNSHYMLNLNQDGEELNQLIYSSMEESALYTQKTITASLGHVLISNDSPQGDMISPPLRGALPLPDILKWVKASETPLTFVPSVPPTIKTVAVDEPRVVHRLIYRTLPQTVNLVSNLPQRTLKFELELSRPPFTSTEAQCPENGQNLQDTSSSDESGSGANLYLSPTGASQPSDIPEESSNGREPGCQVGKEVYINLMFPDRPMDVQFCIFDWDSIPLRKWPQVLQEYTNQLRDFAANGAQLSRLDPPSTFSYEGQTYYLYNSLKLRQSSSRNFPSAVSGDRYVDDLVEVSTEHMVDLQSNQKMESCEVKFDGSTGEVGWKHFLTVCDRLSTFSLVRQRKRDNIDEPQTIYVEI